MRAYGCYAGLAILFGCGLAHPRVGRLPRPRSARRWWVCFLVGWGLVVASAV